MTQQKKIEQLAGQLLGSYQQVDDIVGMIEAAESNLDRKSLMEKLSVRLAEVKSVESEMTPLRESIQEQGQSLEPQTRAAIDQTVELVRQLLPRLGRLEQETVEQRSQLAPQIHQGVRAIQMQSAYTRNR